MCAWNEILLPHIYHVVTVFFVCPLKPEISIHIGCRYWMLGRNWGNQINRSHAIQFLLQSPCRARQRPRGRVYCARAGVVILVATVPNRLAREYVVVALGEAHGEHLINVSTETSPDYLCSGRGVDQVIRLAASTRAMTQSRTW